MSHFGCLTERWLDPGFRVPRRDLGGVDTLASSLSGGGVMIGRETRVLLRHYLEQGMSKAAIARQLGVNRRTVHRWIAAGQLDRELDGEAVRYGPRRGRSSKLDLYRPRFIWTVDWRQELGSRERGRGYVPGEGGEGSDRRSWRGGAAGAMECTAEDGCGAAAASRRRSGGSEP